LERGWGEVQWLQGRALQKVKNINTLSPHSFKSSGNYAAISRKLSGAPENALPPAGSFPELRKLCFQRRGTFRNSGKSAAVRRRFSGVFEEALTSAGSFHKLRRCWYGIYPDQPEP